VNFSSVRVLANGNNDTFPRSEVNVAMRNLIEIIWKEGGYRFRHTATNGENGTYQYRCSQDIMHAKHYQSRVEVEKQRDGRRMARFPCQSKLNIRPLLHDRTLSISFHHEWHAPYDSIELSPAVQELIESRVSTKTPSEIYRDIRDTSEGQVVTRHQVYYLWSNDSIPKIPARFPSEGFDHNKDEKYLVKTKEELWGCLCPVSI
jgi:hypothetical protein